MNWSEMTVNFCIRCMTAYLCNCLMAILIFEPVFERAYFGTDFAAIRRNKFAARYFWFKAKLKQKKFIFK